MFKSFCYERVLPFWNRYIWYTAPKSTEISKGWSLEEAEAEWNKETKIQKTYYALCRLVKKVLDFPSDLYYDVKYDLQRIDRGWSDRDCWSIDYHLNHVIPQMMKRLKETKHGVPCSCYDVPYKENTTEAEDKKAQDKWDDILDTIIFTFETHQKINDEGLVMPQSFRKRDIAKWQRFCDKMNEKYPGEYRIMTKEEVKRYKLGWKYLQQYWGSFWN